MERKSVVLIVAHEGYQPVEYEETKKVLTSGGIDVITASNIAGMAIASDKTTTNAKLATNDIIANRYAGIFFIGGPGALDDLDNETSYSLTQEAANAGILLGAICIAPRILAKAEVLKNKTATGWDEDGKLESILTQYDAHYKKDSVVQDGTIITATGPSTAKQFGKKILEALKSRK